MKEHNQIAAAAKCLIQFCEICDVKVPVSQLPKCKNALEQAESIILSAIEKVERDAFQRGWNDREARYNAAQASEPLWEIMREFVGDKQIPIGRRSYYSNKMKAAGFAPPARASEPFPFAEQRTCQIAEARNKIGEIFLAPGERFSSDHASQIDAIIETVLLVGRTRKA